MRPAKNKQASCSELRQETFSYPNNTSNLPYIACFKYDECLFK